MDALFADFVSTPVGGYGIDGKEFSNVVWFDWELCQDSDNVLPNFNVARARNQPGNPLDEIPSGILIKTY